MHDLILIMYAFDGSNVFILSKIEIFPSLLSNDTNNTRIEPFIAILQAILAKHIF